jgi:phosphotransferase system enzyme I (PtsI)
VLDDIERGRGFIAAAHLKETIPGVYRDMKFGEGHTDYVSCVGLLYSMGVRIFTGEFWHKDGDDWRRSLSDASSFLRKKIDTAMERYLADKEAERKFISVQPLMADGTRIDIGLNIGSSSPAALEGAKYTDMVGLFRTEFLYMEKPALPDEQEQFEAYKKILREYAPRPVTIRTLDIGGDKTLECMNMPREDNPFLGNRALRLCFDKPNIFKTQIRALLRASVHGSLWIMLPMVGSIDDIRRAKSMIDDVRVELDREDIACSSETRIGIMVEIPSIALIADIAAQEVDFASIGTNDLCQYLTATDRLNPYVSGYYQSYHPAMFRIIGHVVEEFDKAGKPICVCGEMGGDKLAVPVLVGLGLRKLSMGISSVAGIKRVLSTLTMEHAARLADAVKNMPTAADVESYLKKISAEGEFQCKRRAQ